MNYTTQSLHDQKVESTAQELRAKGYAVLIAPLISDLPFNLGGYRPTLIATKNDTGIVLEVRTSLKSLSIDQFQEIAAQISAQKGWRFLLVTLDDINEKELISDVNDLPSWEELNSQLSKLNILLQESLFEPALLFSWSILEAALRKRAIMQHLPIERFPATQLLNHIYSSGEISISEYELFQHCLSLRNRVAHGLLTNLDPEISKTLSAANDTLQTLVAKWKKHLSGT